jgi:hypothetical protein
MPNKVRAIAGGSFGGPSRIPHSGRSRPSTTGRGCVITPNSAHGVTGISSVPIWKAMSNDLRAAKMAVQALIAIMSGAIPRIAIARFRL